jgi:nitroreductase
MNILEAIQTRHSVRDFDPRPVSRQVLMQIMQAATLSPSSGNGQPWEIFIATGDTLETIRQAVLERAAQASAAPVGAAAAVAGGAALPAVPPPPPAPQTVYQQRFAEVKRQRLELLGLDPDDPQSYTIFNQWAARLYGAPAVAVICQDGALKSTLDIGLLVQSMCLAAMHFGVDTLIAANFVSHPDLLREALEIPESLKIVTGVGLGYANPDAIINTYRAPRRPIGEVVRYKG